MENNDFELSQDQQMVAAGSEAKVSADGYKVNSDDDFTLVQQDKSIHDTHFTTKPTTFFRDAIRRFTKDRSSVTGGIILGVLFLLAIILPFTIPYDIENSHNYETNLPPKLFNAGSGFWDGTKSLSNQPYPYDENGNYIGEYTDRSAILKISDKYTGYGEGQTSDGKGGFVRINGNATDTSEKRYMYSATYSFDFNNTYMLNYSLGSTESEDIVQYGVVFRIGTEGALCYLPVDNGYGDKKETSLDYDKGQTVYLHKTQTVNLTELITNSSEITLESNKVLSGKVGLYFETSTTTVTNFYVHDIAITSDKASESETLETMSFSDANEVMGQSPRDGTRENPSYWAIRSDASAIPVDVQTTRCTMLIDMYKVQYGYRSGMNVESATFDAWKEKGYINFDYSDASSFEVTNAGKNQVYVYSVQSIKPVTVSGKTAYNMTCTILMYRYLGYSSMPRHLLGTEGKGRDLLKYVFAGLRNSLLLGIIVSAINILIGVVWGSISGYFGGTVDLVMERITDILSGMPWIVLMTVLTLNLGQNFFVFGLALCLTGWIGTESITRSQFYRYRGREYVLASKTLGAKAPRLIFRHILPNAIGTIVTSSILMIPSVIFSESTISYLGLGLKGQASLGVILSDNQAYLRTYPYQLIVPAVIISLLMICFNLFGNGLRDAFNPSLKGQE